jgi:DNA polymerase III delta subunit
LRYYTYNMKIIILDGPGEVGKRQHLSRIKAKYEPDAITTVDWKQSSESELKTLLQSVPMFVTERLIVVENASDAMDLTLLGTIDDATTLVLVAGTLGAKKKLLETGAQVSAQHVVFDGDKETSAFPFLDALIEGKKSAYVELEKLLAEYGWVYVLTMVYYLLRRNLLPAPASQFLKTKIAAQKKRYTNEDFRKLYLHTLETEYQLKTGAAEPHVALTTLVSRFVNVS